MAADGNLEGAASAPIPPATLEHLARVSSATLTSQLLKRGFRRTFLAGLMRSRTAAPMIGRAFTLRYAPTREDVGFHVDYDNERDLQRIAVEKTPPGAVLVLDARGELGAASFGHIIATRMAVRGVAGLVTDGCLRDSAQFHTVGDAGLLPGARMRRPPRSRTGRSTFRCRSAAPACSIMPGDVMFGDEEGVVVIPAAIADEVATRRRNSGRGGGLRTRAHPRERADRDLYPLRPSRQADYEAWRRARAGTARNGVS